MIKAIIKSLRIKQWIKNTFVLAALIFDRQLTNRDATIRTFYGVFLFCLISSSVYLLNDVMDIEVDKKHPIKKLRPIASGELPISLAIIIALFLIVFSLFFSYLLSPLFALIGLIYFSVNILYSKWLKKIPIIDVLIIALGFVLRVGAGVTLISIERFSPWLYVVTTLGALYIGFGKRRAELSLLKSEANKHRSVLDGYSIPYLDQLITIVSSTTIIAYSLYTFSAPNLPKNHLMMLTIPFVLYGIFRYLYLIQVKDCGGSPEEILLSDRPLQLCILLWGLSIMCIFYINGISNLFM